MNSRVRIAPSPTGYPHIGTIYQALFNWGFARHTGGTFFVRIEDTDRTRFVEGAEDVIFSSLDWFGLIEDESARKGGPYAPYRQSERLDIYKKYAEELIEKGGAYYCFCTKERLEALRQEQMAAKKPTMYDRHCRNVSKEEVQEKLSRGEPWVIRLKMPDNKDFIVRDEIRGDIHFDLTLIEDAVLLKTDGYPTYHLGAMVDDHLMQTTHIIRAEEWLPSLPKHVVLFDYFGWDKPLFYHTPALRNPDKSKLSKRHGHTNVQWYKEEGYLPQAILNYLALLTWSHPEEKEMFSLDEFVKYFDIKDIKPVGPIFDLVKLTWLNGEYIRQMTDEELVEKLRAFFADDTEVLKVLDEQSDLIGLAKTRLKTLKEFKELVIPAEITLTDEEKAVANDLAAEFERISDWNKDTILEAMRAVLQKNKIKGSMLYKILTGRERGLPLPETLELLGKEAALKKLSK